jgi:hypothetical protein
VVIYLGKFVKESSKRKSGLFGLFGKRIDPVERERLPGQKVAAPKFEKPKKLNKRAISGDRVVCACSMQLPKVDAFNHLKIHRKGYLIFNARGGAFYIPQQFTENTVKQLFKPGEPGLIKDFKLYPKGKQAIVIGQVSARFLYFVGKEPWPGMVMRFGNLNERQLDTLNKLVKVLPKVETSEQAFIQRAQRKR